MREKLHIQSYLNMTVGVASLSKDARLSARVKATKGPEAFPL